LRGSRHKRHDFGMVVAQYANYTIGVNVRFWTLFGSREMCD
jgi:hypothetical protein